MVLGTRRVTEECVPEQVPEIQEIVDRQRTERGSSHREAADEAQPAAEGWSVRRRLWILISVATAGFVVLGAGQLWFFSRPRSTMLGVLFPMGYVLFNALLVAGIVGLVVSLQLRHETRRHPHRVSHMEALVRLHGQGAIDDEELLRALRDTVRERPSP